MKRLQSGAAIAAVLCITLQGCAGIRIYNESRDKQGAAAKEAWSKVDLATLVISERDNLNKLLKLELETQEQLALAIRDDELRSMVGAEHVGMGLFKRTNDRLKLLAGATEKFQTSLDVLRDASTNGATLQDTQEVLQELGLQVPDCSALQGGSVPANLQASINKLPGAKVAMEAAKRLVSKCIIANAGGPDHARKVAYQLAAGQGRTELGNALDQYEQDTKALSAKQAEAKALQAAYNKAKKEYDDIVANAKSDSNLLTEVQQKSALLKTAIDNIEKAQNAFSTKFLSEERLSLIGQIFQTAAETKPGDPLPAETNNAAAALVIVPNLIDDARKALADTKKPLALPLLIRRNYEELNLEAAQRDIDSLTSMTDLSSRWADAVYAEARQLWIASKGFTEGHVSDFSDQSFLVAFATKCSQGAADKTCRDDKERLYRGATLYLDAVGRLEANCYKLQYMRIAAIHERALAYSEVNMKQWQSLIDASVTQVADYYAGGIKGDQIIALLNAAGIGAIAAGVNK